MSILCIWIEGNCHLIYRRFIKIFPHKLKALQLYSYKLPRIIVSRVTEIFLVKSVEFLGHFLFRTSNLYADGVHRCKRIPKIVMISKYRYINIKYHRGHNATLMYTKCNFCFYLTTSKFFTRWNQSDKNKAKTLNC